MTVKDALWELAVEQYGYGDDDLQGLLVFPATSRPDGRPPDFARRDRGWVALPSVVKRGLSPSGDGA